MFFCCFFFPSTKILKINHLTNLFYFQFNRNSDDPFGTQGNQGQPQVAEEEEVW